MENFYQLVLADAKLPNRIVGPQNFLFPIADKLIPNSPSFQLYINLVERLNKGLSYFGSGKFILHGNNCDLPLCVSVVQNGAGIGIQIEGYSDFTSDDQSGHIVVIYQHENDVVMNIHADINLEEPTHIISLEGASIRNRIDHG